MLSYLSSKMKIDFCRYFLVISLTHLTNFLFSFSFFSLSLYLIEPISTIFCKFFYTFSNILFLLIFSSSESNEPSHGSVNTKCFKRVYFWAIISFEGDTSGEKERRLKRKKFVLLILMTVQEWKNQINEINRYIFLSLFHFVSSFSRFMPHQLFLPFLPSLSFSLPSLSLFLLILISLGGTTTSSSSDKVLIDILFP